MKYLIAFIATLIMLYSCTKPHPPSATADFHIINQTNHKINLIYFSGEIIDSSEALFILDSIYYNRKVDDFGDLGGPPPFRADSVEVIFNDSIKIVHYRIQNQGINKNIFYVDSWILEIIGEYEYKYDYIFTEGDYLEAKER
jgi:hypothetical protein